MKTIKTLLAVCLLATATTVSAQFADGTADSKKSSSTAVNTDSYSRLYVSYNPLTIKHGYSGNEDMILDGYSIGFTNGISVVDNLPLFVDVGIRLNYGFKKENVEEKGTYGTANYYSKDNKYSYLGINLPINLAYKWSFGSSSFSITPFLGITLKGNIISNKKIIETMSQPYGEDIKEKTEDNFEKNDVNKNGVWKRVQAGWQAGIGFDYKHLYFGVHYGRDFNEVCKNKETSNWGVSVGFNFY